MDDLNTILGIVVLLPLVTLFFVYWLDAKTASPRVVPDFRATSHRHSPLETDPATCGAHCKMPSR